MASAQVSKNFLGGVAQKILRRGERAGKKALDSTAVL